MQQNHKARDKWVYALIALVIVVFYGLLGKADVATAKLEQTANGCGLYTSQSAYQACIDNN